jgi:hypothetical protein
MADERERELLMLIMSGVSEKDAARMIAEREASKGSPMVQLARGVTKRLGIGEAYPKSDITVEVTAPRPPAGTLNDPGSGRMMRTMLGTSQERPTGAYVPRDNERLIGPPGENLPPRVNAIWNKVRAEHPYVSRSVDAVRMNPRMSGENIAAVPMTRSNAIEINPARLDGLSDEQLRGALLHELTHVSQKQNYPSLWERLKKLRGFRLGGEAGFIMPYAEQLGEAQATDVQIDAMTPRQRKR